MCYQKPSLSSHLARQSKQRCARTLTLKLCLPTTSLEPHARFCKARRLTEAPRQVHISRGHTAVPPGSAQTTLSSASQAPTAAPGPGALLGTAASLTPYHQTPRHVSALLPTPNTCFQPPQLGQSAPSQARPSPSPHLPAWPGGAWSLPRQGSLLPRRGAGKGRVAGAFNLTLLGTLSILSGPPPTQCILSHQMKSTTPPF